MSGSVEGWGIFWNWLPAKVPGRPIFGCAPGRLCHTQSLPLGTAEKRVTGLGSPQISEVEQGLRRASTGTLVKGSGRDPRQSKATDPVWGHWPPWVGLRMNLGPILEEDGLLQSPKEVTFSLPHPRVMSEWDCRSGHWSWEFTVACSWVPVCHGDKFIEKKASRKLKIRAVRQHFQECLLYGNLANCLL